MIDFSLFAQRAELRNITGIDPEAFDGVYIGDLLSRAMSHVESGNLWITIMNNSNVIAVATLTDPAAVILAEDVDLIAEAKTIAKQKGIPVYGTSLTAYELCRIAATLDK